MNFTNFGGMLISFEPEDLDPWGNLYIPSHVREIDSLLFKGCTSLISINQSTETPFPNDIEDTLFSYQKDPALRQLVRVIFHPEIIKIGCEAFQDCTSLISVTLVENMVLGNNAFKNCSKLESIYLPKGTYIGKGAFSHCENLKSVILSSAVQINSYAFSKCTQLKKVILEKNIATEDSSLLAKAKKTIGVFAFYNCANLMEVWLPPTTSLIKKCAFMGVKDRCFIVLPKNINLHSKAFGETPELFSIVCPDPDYDYVCARLNTLEVSCASFLEVRDKFLKSLKLPTESKDYMKKEQALKKIPLPKGKMTVPMKVAFIQRIQRVLYFLPCIEELASYVENNRLGSRNFPILPSFITFFSSEEFKKEQELRKVINAVEELIHLMSVGKKFLGILSQKKYLTEGPIGEILEHYLDLEIARNTTQPNSPLINLFGLSAVIAVAAFFVGTYKNKSYTLVNHIGKNLCETIREQSSSLSREHLADVQL